MKKRHVKNLDNLIHLYLNRLFLGFIVFGALTIFWGSIGETSLRRNSKHLGVVCEQLLLNPFGSKKNYHSQMSPIMLRWANERGWAFSALPVSIQNNPLIAPILKALNFDWSSADERSKSIAIGSALSVLINREPKNQSEFRSKTELHLELLPFIQSSTVAVPNQSHEQLLALSHANRDLWKIVFAKLQDKKELSAEEDEKLRTILDQMTPRLVKTYPASEQTMQIPLVKGHLLKKLGMSYEFDLYQNMHPAPASIGFDIQFTSAMSRVTIDDSDRRLGLMTMEYRPPQPGPSSFYVHPQFESSFELFHTALSLSPDQVGRWIDSQFLYLSQAERANIYQWTSAQWFEKYPPGISEHRFLGLLSALHPLIMNGHDFSSFIEGAIKTYLIAHDRDSLWRSDFLHRLAVNPQAVIDSQVLPFFNIPKGFRARVFEPISSHEVSTILRVPGESPRTGLVPYQPTLFPLRDRRYTPPSLD